ncbi:MAG: VWA domain-containing protein, partial [Acidobacteriota bacterium]
MHGIFHRVTPIPLLVCLFGAVAASGAQTEEQPKGYRFETEVLLIPVPVFVTDSEGNPIKNLTADDFIIKEQGKVRPVVFFQPVDYERLSVDEQGRRKPMPPGMRRQFLLLFDLTFSTPRGLLRARETALNFIRHQLLPADLVAVATYSNLGGLRMLSNFTTDHRHAEFMVGTLGLVRSTDVIQDPVGFVFDNLLEVPVGPGNVPHDFEGMEAQLFEHVRSLYDRLRQSDEDAYRSQASQYLGQFSSLNSALRSMSGRKYILLFSEGIDSRFLTGTGVTEMDTDFLKFVEGRVSSIDSDNRFGRVELRDILMEGLERAAAADVVIHALDISGLGGQAGDHPGTGEGRGQDTLYLMANETGGRLYKNLNDLREPLQKIIKESSSFYLLGFYPRDLKAKGRFRKIEVEVKRQGLRVSHRRGYYEPTAPDKLSPVERNLQVAEYVTKDLLSDDVFFDVIASAYPGQGLLARVPVFLKFPGNQFFEAKRRSDVLQIELYGYTIDGGGQFVDFFNKTLSFDLKRDGSRLKKKGFKYYDLLFAKPGPVRLK